MGFRTYAEVLSVPAVRRVLLLATLIRIPLWSSGVVVALHVVTHLHQSYARAGMVDMALALALAVSGPWRGRRLDRVGLRRSVAPSLVVLLVCWCVAPWLGYWALFGLVVVAGLFTVPQFSIVRQVLLSAVGPTQRKTALAIDSVAVEIAFMIGPVLGVLLATALPTPVALMVTQLLSLAGGLALWLINPPLRSDGDESDQPTAHSVRGWLGLAVCGVLVTCVAATVVLNGAELATVAALRAMGGTSAIGVVLAVWGAGSAIGGIVYGGMRRHPSSSVLMALLAASTLLVVVADGPVTFGALLFLSGLFCAPTITATIDDLARLVPASVRGEAMGWHGSALTLGAAAGAPLVGVAIDAGSWRAGILLCAVGGLVIAVLSAAAVRVGAHRRTRPAASAYDDHTLAA